MILKQWISAFSAAALIVCSGVFVLAQTTGPSSSASPYLVSTAPGVSFTSILTTGDSVNLNPGGMPYRMGGIPDGLGAFDNGDGTFTILMNHEIPGTSGIVRAHGAAGAYVSKWIVRKSDLAVLNGADLIQNIATWNPATSSYNAPAQGIVTSRYCSADLPPISAFFNAATQIGFNGRIYMNGEETGDEGRAFGHLLNGTSYELPYLGKFSWENSLAHPNAGNKTIVVGTDDTTPGQVYVYVGNKTNTGNEIARAGLSNGTLYGVKVAGIPVEDRLAGVANGTSFSMFSLGNVSNMTGAQLQAASVANGVTEFLRPEDGHWDANNPRDFYFVTTDRFDTVKTGTGTTIGRSRLYRLRFDDINNPDAGGTVDMLIDGTEDHQMLDNMTIDKRGRVLLQEDPGGNPYLARIQSYNTRTDQLTAIARHDPNRFITGAPNFLTENEEASGIIDVSDILGAGWYLQDVQAHYSIPGELVEGGQLLAMYYAPGTTGTQFDYDGDARSDISVFRPANNTWYTRQSNGNFSSVQFGATGDIITPADYDGDGRTDIGVFRPSTGTWHYINSSTSQNRSIQFGQSGDIPLPGDFDGDGRDDINVFRPSSGIWYRINSSNNQFVAAQYGLNGDVPLQADFDGDGKTDLAVYRPSQGTFYWMRSSNGQNASLQFGTSTDIPTVGDYDGDGKTDVSVFRPSNGTWYRINSTNGTLTAIAFGQSGDVPAAADYDGDGRADLAVFRNGVWYLRQSTAGLTTINFGSSGDEPTPAAFN